MCKCILTDGTDFHREGKVVVETVLCFQLRTAGIGTDTGLTYVGTENGAAAGL